jgi:hypothetical protein
MTNVLIDSNHEKRVIMPKYCELRKGSGRIKDLKGIESVPEINTYTDERIGLSCFCDVIDLRCIFN